jgi:hypothetical protein
MGQDDKVRQGEDTNLKSSESLYDKLLAEDATSERRVLWSELAIVALIAFLAIAYLILA